MQNQQFPGVLVALASVTAIQLRQFDPSTFSFRKHRSALICPFMPVAASARLSARLFLPLADY